MSRIGAAISKRVGEEPVRTMGVIQSGVALGVGFGLELSPEQFGLVMSFLAALLSWLVRKTVTPVAAPNLPPPTPLPGFEPPND